MTSFMHPILAAWIGDPETERMLGFEAELAAILRFEGALAEAQAALGLIPNDAVPAIRAALDGFTPDLDALRGATARDGVVVPGLVAQLRPPAGEAGRYLHYGATSQDVVDTALMLRLAGLLPDYARRLGAIEARLDDLREAWGARPLMAVTRMRDALPITVADRMANWTDGVRAARGQIDRVAVEDTAVQLAGPVGTLHAFGSDGPVLRAALAERLGLRDPGASWHVERGRILRIGAALSACAVALGKIGADVGLMAQDGIGAVRLRGGGSSSMPHKVNPVDAELLVALATHAGASHGALVQAGVHACERSGAAWALEWLSLPALLRATGGAIRATERLLDAVIEMG